MKIQFDVCTTYEVHTKTIIHLGVEKSGGHLPRRFQHFSKTLACGSCHFYISFVFSNARRALSQCNTRLRLFKKIKTKTEVDNKDSALRLGLK